MRQLKYLFTAALMLFAVTACDEGEGVTETPPPLNGTVSGVVTAEGEPIIGASVTISGGGVQQVGASDGTGSFSFTGLDAGTYTVSVGAVEGVTFATTSQSVTLSQTSSSASVAFNGEFVRTASIQGTVTIAGAPAANIQVTLSGDDSRAGATDASGNYAFTGLRAGTYTVTITPPAGVTFDITSRSVTIGTGDAEVVSFAGDRPLTATVAIKSVTQAVTNAPVNPANVNGQIDVTVLLNDPQNQVTQIQVLVDGEPCGGCTQTFGVAGEGASPEEAPSGEYVFSINTADFDAQTGEASYTNKDTDITVEASTAGGDATASGVTLTFNNANTWHLLSAGAPNGPIADANGNPYTGNGDYVAEAALVFYSGGAELQSASGALQPFAAADDVSCDGNTCTFTWDDSVDGATVMDNALRLTATLVGGGSVITTVIPNTANNGTGVWIDNGVPTGLELWLANQGNASDCCAANWVGPDYPLEDGYDPNSTAADAGIGLGDVTFHVGPAGDTNAEIAATAAVDDVSGMAETSTTNTLSLVAQQCDLLDNCATVRLSSNGALNTLTTIGIDATAPTNAFSTGAGTTLADMAIANAATALPAPGSWQVVPTDAGTVAASGFNAGTSHFVRVYRNFSTDTDGDGVGTGTNCFVGVETTADVCEFATVGSFVQAAPAPSTVDIGYWTFESLVRDQAGNRSAVVMRSILNDGTLPTVSNVAIPSSLVGGAPTTFSATVSDNLDLGSVAPSLLFGAPFSSYWQFKMATSLGTSFDATFVTSVTDHPETFNFVRSIERFGTAAAPNTPAADIARALAERIRFIVTDAAGNQSAAENIFSAGSVTGGTWTGFASTTMTTYDIATNLPQICNGLTTTACPVANDPTSSTITITATGPSTTFSNPYTSMWIFRDDTMGTVAVMGQATFVGVTPGPGAGEQTFSWTYTFDGAGRAPAMYELIGVGFNGSGDVNITGTLVQDVVNGS